MGFILAKINFSRGMFVCYKIQTLVFNRLYQNRPKENLNSISTHPLIYFNQSVNIGGNSQGPFSGSLVKIFFSTRLKITSILERLYTKMQFSIWQIKIHFSSFTFGVAESLLFCWLFILELGLKIKVPVVYFKTE